MRFKFKANYVKGLIIAAFMLTNSSYASECCEVEIQPSIIYEPKNLPCITLESAWRKIVRQSPLLSYSFHSYMAQQGTVLQAGLMPNPQFIFDIDDFGGRTYYRGFQIGDTCYSIAQVLEIGGKRRSREAAAEAAALVLEWEYKEIEAKLREELEQSFATIAIIQEKKRLVSKTYDIAQKALCATNTLSSSGKIAPIQIQKAKITLHQTKHQLLIIEDQLAREKLKLVNLWGGCESDFCEILFPISEIKALPCLDTLLLCLNETPDRLKVESEVYAAWKILRAERARRFPDVTVIAGCQTFHNSNDCAVTFELALPLPVFDRNQGNIRRAEAELNRAIEGLQYFDNNKITLLKTTFQQCNSAYERAINLQMGLIAEADNGEDLYQTAYNEGAVDYFDLLDAQQTCFICQELFLDTLLEYHQSLATLARLTGTSAYKDSCCSSQDSLN